MHKVNIGKCFRQAQAESGISTLKVAKDFGVFRQQVQRWRDAEDMHIHKIQEFAKYFGYSLEDFLRLSNAEKVD